ncbi:S8 family serine peptidase [Alcanivorax sp. 1008]|uniref:S8 family serine peptidase n=1 Tax=Alcanivorax sp. 1008 TaxID=2816853 RepID=UPI001DD36FC5|nr:S8 family serine peptidase [Alcanivorax sp. 1008]MCC1496903.1 S8 family serine peptidase [Alcanivorax sp. 1008]
MSSQYRVSLILASALAMTACGGGSGGGGGGSSAAGMRAPTSVIATETAGGDVAITWRDNASAEAGYRILARDAIAPGAIPQAISSELPANTESFVATDLLPGINYDIFIEAFNDDATSLASTSILVDGGGERFLTAYFEVQPGVYYEAGLAGSGNHTENTAAPIPVGATVIGLADGGTGSSDYFFAENVPAGSSVVLTYLQEHPNEDLDVDVFDTDLNVLAFSAAPAGVDEEASIPSAGAVIIRVLRDTVNSCCGPQKYSLAILTPAQQLSYSPLTTSMAKALYSSDAETVPYTAVKIDKRGASKSRALSVAREQSEIVYANKRGGTVERISFSRPSAQRSIGVMQNNAIEDKRDTVKLVKQYAKMNRGASVIPAVMLNQASISFASGTPPVSDPLAATDWQFAAHNGAEGWLWTRGLDADGTPVTVGVVDSGVYPTADLSDALLNGYWVYRDPEDRFGPLVTNNFQEVGARGNGLANTHGTMVASIIAAERNNGAGNTGYIPDANILPVRGTAPGESAYDNAALVAAIEWATDNGADVINLSVTSAEQGWSPVAEGVWYAISNDVPVMGAAGNSGSRLTPGNVLVGLYGRDDGAWGVTAYARDGDIASYSSYGPYVHIAAAVGEVADQTCVLGILGTAEDPVNPDLSDFFEGTHCEIGTSFSAPVVTAAVGMMKAINPDLTNVQLQALLQAGELTNADSGGAFTEEAGYGLIDFGKAARAAASGQIDTSMVNVSGDLDFAGFRTEMPLTIDRDGFPGHSLEFSGVPAGITITAADVDDSGFGDYLVTYDRDVAAEAVSATITVTTSEGKMDTFAIAGYTAEAGDPAASYVGIAQMEVWQGDTFLASGAVEAVGPLLLRFHATKAATGFTLDSTPYLLILTHDTDGDTTSGQPGEVEQGVLYRTVADESVRHTRLGPFPVTISLM